MGRNRRPTGIDLFAGAGGLSLGFEQAGFDVVAAVEIDPIHCATHEFNFPNSAVICRSVADLTGAEIRKRAGIGERELDAVFGGAPCQGFSTMGKRALDDPRNKLVFHFVRLVVELQPRFFVFENVKGLTMGGHRRFLYELLTAFNEAGYNVRDEYRVLNAAEFGVPQDRRRLFLLGSRRDVPLPDYPAPICRPRGSRNEERKLTLFAHGMPVGPGVSEAISDLPGIESHESLFESDSVRAKFGKPSKYAKYLRGLADDPFDFSYRREYDSSILTSSMRTVHTPLSQERFELTPHGETEPISRFHKLDPEGICNTLRAGTASDRGAFTSPRPIHPIVPRCITVREAARLHSYPDWFRFHVTKWHGMRQIGNSVPPLLGRAVATQLVRAAGIQAQKPEVVVDLGNPRLLALTMAEAAARYGVPATVIPKRKRVAA